MAKRIFIVSGEESGDLHGAALIGELRKLMPGLEAGGMGGVRMREAGLRGLNSKEVSVVGVVEVFERLPQILRSFSFLKNELANGDYSALVLIDFPDFNLRFAKKARGLGIPIIYYISPQVWAWRKGRIKDIARLVDKMLVVFPFEEGLYRAAGVDVDYVGHPLADIATCSQTKSEARKSLGLPEGSKVIALLPGSRTGEVSKLLPDMLKAAGILADKFSEKPVFVLPAANSIADELLAGYIKASGVEVRVLRGSTYTVLRASDAAAVASGTATLETALIGTPMALVYRMSPVSYAIAKVLVGLKHAGLPNIVAGKEVIKELIQGSFTPQALADELASLLNDADKRKRMADDFALIKERLGGGGAAARAASAIFGVVEKWGSRQAAVRTARV